MDSRFPVNAPLAERLDRLTEGREGFLPSLSPDVRLMRVERVIPSTAIAYEPSIVILAQGRKRGRLAGRTFVYDARDYLVLSVPMPFECETIGSREEPMLGMSIRVHAATVAELVLEMDKPAFSGSPRAIDAIPLTPELANAAERLATCLASPSEARILGPQIVREITYFALLGGQGAALQALAAPQTHFGQIARALRRIHLEYAADLDVGTLARDAGMSVSAFHARFKAVTSLPPQRYLQTIRLHKAQGLMVGGLSAAEAAGRVGYESASQFSREFKRLFGGTPREVAARSRRTLFAF